MTDKQNMSSMNASSIPSMSLEEMLRFQMSLLRLVTPEETPRKPPVRVDGGTAHDEIAQLVAKVAPRRKA